MQFHIRSASEPHRNRPDHECNAIAMRQRQIAADENGGAIAPASDEYPDRGGWVPSGGARHGWRRRRGHRLSPWDRRKELHQDHQNERCQHSRTNDVHPPRPPLRCGRERVRRPPVAAHDAPDRTDEVYILRVLDVYRPSRQIRRLNVTELERKRNVPVGGDRYEHVTLQSPPCFVLYPLRPNRMSGPHHDDAACRRKLLLDHIRPRLAGQNAMVPPHGPPFCFECRSERACVLRVFFRVTEKNVCHRRC